MKSKKNKLHIRKGDSVKVLAGNDKGKTGRVLEVVPSKYAAYVEGIKMVTKHVKPSQANQEGRIDRFEASIHYSNVLLYCKESDRGERIRIQINDDNSKTRIFTKSGTPAE